jgi:hypothetical protein
MHIKQTRNAALKGCDEHIATDSFGRPYRKQSEYWRSGSALLLAILPVPGR